MIHWDDLIQWETWYIESLNILRWLDAMRDFIYWEIQCIEDKTWKLKKESFDEGTCDKGTCGKGTWEKKTEYFF